MQRIYIEVFILMHYKLIIFHQIFIAFIASDGNLAVGFRYTSRTIILLL